MTSVLVPPQAGAASQPAPPLTPYEPFDAEYCRDLMQHVITPICDGYFRPRIIGAEKLPKRGPVVLTANHSGTAFPYDAIVFDFALWRAAGLDPLAKFRTVFEPELSLTWWMRPFGIDNLWRRGGGVDMTFDNFDRLLRQGERVIYYPEGVPGIGKGFPRRYQLQRFSSSFLLVAARYDAPIFPVSVVNAEWVMPFHVTFKPLDRFMDRFFRVPFLPLPAGVLALLIPWMWYLALPARMTFVIGDPIDPRAALRESGIEEYEHPERELMKRATKRIRLRMQKELDGAVAEHGSRPYDWRSLLGGLRRAGRKVLRVLPLGWPVAFVRHERDRRRKPARNRVHAMVRDLDLIAFYLPFGWPLLALSRRFRKPPYGFRGLSRAESDERQGAFVWRLAERPLPSRAR